MPKNGSPTELEITDAAYAREIYDLEKSSPGECLDTTRFWLRQAQYNLSFGNVDFAQAQRDMASIAFKHAGSDPTQDSAWGEKGLLTLKNEVDAELAERVPFIGPALES